MYEIFSQASPCLKMVSPRPYSKMVLAIPDESRKARALNNGTARLPKREAFRAFIDRALHAAGPRTCAQKNRTGHFREWSDGCSQLNIADGAAGLNSSVDSGQRTPAEKTAAIISRATQTGAPLCIPGGLEVRAARAVRRAPDATSATERAPSAEKDRGMASDRERREYQLAGGGAPSERGITRRESVIERLCQLLRWRPGRRVETHSRSNALPLSSLPVTPRRSG